MQLKLLSHGAIRNMKNKHDSFAPAWNLTQSYLLSQEWILDKCSQRPIHIPFHKQSRLVTTRLL